MDLHRWAYIGLVMALLGLAAWLYLGQTTEVAWHGYEVRQLQDRKERLRRELTALRAQVAMAGSLTRLEALAEELDYVMPEATDTSRRLVVEYRLPDADAEATDPLQGQEANVAAAEAEPGVARFVRGLVGQMGEWFGVASEGGPTP